MDLKQLELLEIVARTGSLSRAAAELGTSQPRLTQQLQLIERELGIRLFHRSARGLTPSEAGSTFLPFVRQIRSAFERGQSAISAVSKKGMARLRLGISFTTSTRMASEFLQEFHKRFPGVYVTLTERNPHELVAALEGGELDLCGGLELPETTTLVRKQIFSTRLVGIYVLGLQVSTTGLSTFPELTAGIVLRRSCSCPRRLSFGAWLPGCIVVQPPLLLPEF
jgi:DNA-binding transcriptional LysR family regulator